MTAFIESWPRWPRSKRGERSLAIEGAPGDAELVQDFERPQRGVRVGISRENIGVAIEKRGHFLRALAEKLDAEMAQARCQHLWNELSSALGLRIKQRIATACVGDQRMRLSNPILQI